MKANKGFKTTKKTHLFATRGFLTFLVTLTEHHYTKGCPQDRQSAPSSSEHVQGDGESVVDQDVAEEDGAQQEVSHSSDRHDGLPESSFSDTANFEMQPFMWNTLILFSLSRPDLWSFHCYNALNFTLA